jgi:integrase
MSKDNYRAHGAGSYYFDETANRWRAELTVGTKPDGSPLRWRKTFPTKAAATAALSDAIVQRNKGNPVIESRATVAEYLADWLETVSRPNTGPRTYLRYRQLVEQHAIPAIGRLRLTRLTPRDLQKLYNDKGATLAPRTVGHLHRCLHTALANAVRWGLVSRNVADVVRPPKVPRTEHAIWNAEQCQRFVTAVQGDPLEAYYLLSLTTGMRPGELRGLRWTDLDLARGTLRLQRTLLRLPGQGWVEQEPKTHQARAISLPALAVESLQRHRVAQLQARLAAGERWQDMGLVFANSVGRPIEPQNILRRSFVPLLERAGLPRIRVYDLRHSAASLLLALGVHPKVVQELLGHSTIRLTMDTYSHSVPTLQASAMAQLDRLLTQDG